MAVEGSERENGGRLVKSDSTESRWVTRDREFDADVDGSPSRRSFDSEDDENAEQRLIRTGPLIDSFDVEALEVPGALRNDYEEFNLGRNLVLMLQTLGVVFGDVGTSPLYTFDVMFNKYPISSKEDVLGALSLVIYTLILIPLVKYILIVLWGNDDGEGGTFALYSLICRHAKASLLPNQLPSDARISSFRLKVPSAELERSLKIKERLEASITLKKLLLMLVLFGTSMVIADGVVTPAMSVMSAVSGLKVGIGRIQQVVPHLNNWISTNQVGVPWSEEVEFEEDYASHIDKDEGPICEVHKFTWVKPNTPYIKINCDASVSTRGVGCGYIMRDEEGGVIFGETVNFDELKTVVEAELGAIYLACSKAQDFGIKFVWLESDSLIAVNLINNVYGTTPKEYKSILNEIYIALSSFEGWTVTHVFREANQVADWLAKTGGSGNEFIFTIDDVPFDILELVANDASGTLYTRVKTYRN